MNCKLHQDLRQEALGNSIWAPARSSWSHVGPALAQLCPMLALSWPQVPQDPPMLPQVGIKTLNMASQAVRTPNLALIFTKDFSIWNTLNLENSRIRESKNVRIQSSKNPRIQESKNPRTQESKNPIRESKKLISFQLIAYDS